MSSETSSRRLPRPSSLVTHDIGEAGFLGHHLVLLRAGRILQRGTLAELIRAPADPFVTDFINAQRGAVRSAGKGPLVSRVERPIFIVGPHRSGTTLLYRILSRHPRGRVLQPLEQALPLVAPSLSPADEDRRRGQSARGAGDLGPFPHERERRDGERRRAHPKSPTGIAS